MTKKKHYPFLLLLMLLFLNGCWDRRELESLALVQALGLDQGPGGKGITITTMIAIPPKIAGGGQSGGGGGGDDTGVFVVSIDAPTIYEGLNRLNNTINREISLLQNSTLIISEDLAKQGIHKWMDNLVRYREMRRTMLIFICKGKTADVMNVKPKLEKNPAEYFRDLTLLSKRTGMFPSANLNNFIIRYATATQENYAPIIAKFTRQQPETGSADAKKPESGNSPSTGGQSGPPPEDIRMVGTAVFKRDKMVGILDNYETQVLLLLTGEFGEAFLTIPDPKRKESSIAFRLLASSPVKIKYRHRGAINSFKIFFRLEADLVSIQSEIDYTTPEMEKYLAQKIAEVLRKRINGVIDKAQKQYHSDVFGFGARIRPTFLISQDWIDYHWLDRFQDAKVETQVKVDIRRVGVQFQPPKSAK